MGLARYATPMSRRLTEKSTLGHATLQALNCHTHSVKGVLMRFTTLIFASTALLAACGGTETASVASATPSETPTTTRSAEITPMERGAIMWKRCRACHNVEEGARHKVGPNLYGIYGMTAGTQDGFNYSKAMRASGIVWDDETMSAYIENPRTYIPGNRMSYVGIRKEEDRQALLLWLKAQSGGNVTEGDAN
jgi:cytochrome c